MKKPGGKKPNRTVTPEERALWRDFTRSAKKLSHVKEERVTTPLENSPPPKIRIPAPVPAAEPKTSALLPALSAGKLTGVDGNLAVRFRKGQLPVEAKLDLHGHTRLSGEEALQKFILRCYDKNKRMLLVITGRGQRGQREDGQKGILQQMVENALGESPLRPYVLAFMQAQRKDGGEGAYYVLLRRQRN